MAKTDFLGSFEQLVLLALLQLGDQAYGMTVRREIERRTGRNVSLGAVYATLDRLEEKGYVRSSAGSGDAERGGRARRYFRVRAGGMKVLRQAIEAFDSMRQALPGLSGESAGATA
jgi:PadR family transcriptional regulator, regulatory protein PadR